MSQYIFSFKCWQELKLSKSIQYIEAAEGGIVKFIGETRKRGKIV